MHVRDTSPGHEVAEVLRDLWRSMPGEMPGHGRAGPGDAGHSIHPEIVRHSHAR